MTNAEFQAEELIKNFDLAIPIDPKTICASISCNSFKIEYYEREFETENIFGISIGYQNEIHINVNSKIKIASRRLFTAAHEIGHVILHIQTGKQIDTKCSNRDIYDNQGKELETEANQFASALLMPSHLIKKKINNQDLTWQLIEQIAQYHQTSLEATARRAISLTKESYALIIHDKNKMHCPVRSNNFSFFIPNSEFPKYLQAQVYKGKGDSSNKLQKCDLSDWRLNLNRNQYNCYYSTLNFKDYHRMMTLLLIEEIAENENEDWEEPRF